MKRVLVVMSGGGAKGLAHIGVLRVLKRLDIDVVAYAGTSVGSLVAAYAASGLTVAEIEKIGLAVRRKSIVDMNWWGMIARRMRVPAANKGHALCEFIKRTLPVDSFDDLQTPLYVNAVELASGANVVFGVPGLRDDPLHRVIAASCSIPGIFPPVEIRGRRFVDGAVVDNLQLRLTRILDIDFVIAINLRSYMPMTTDEVEKMGFLDVINRGNDLTGETITEVNLAMPTDVPGIIIHPDVADHHYLNFDNTPALIAEGERATEAALARYQRMQERNGSVWSWLFGTRSRKVGNPFVIDQKRCVRCGLCVINNPDHIFRQSGLGGKVSVQRDARTTHDVAPLKECPFGAIAVDADLLQEMYGDAPPPHLAELAANQREILGHPPFAPREGEVPEDAGETDEEESASSSSRLRLLRWGSSRRKPVVPDGRKPTSSQRLAPATADEDGGSGSTSGTDADNGTGTGTGNGTDATDKNNGSSAAATGDGENADTGLRPSTPPTGD